MNFNQTISFVSKLFIYIVLLDLFNLLFCEILLRNKVHKDKFPHFFAVASLYNSDSSHFGICPGEGGRDLRKYSLTAVWA